MALVTLGHTGVWEGVSSLRPLEGLSRTGSHAADTGRHVTEGANPPAQNAPSSGLAQGRSPRRVTSHYRIDIATAAASFSVPYVK